MWLVVKIKSTYITVSLFYFTILIEKFHHLLLSQWWVKLKPSWLIWFSCEWLGATHLLGLCLLLLLVFFILSSLCFVEELPHLLGCLSVFWCTQEVGGNTKRSRVFLPTPSCCGRFLRALQQNRAQTRLLYLFHIKLRLPSKSVGVYWTCIGSQVNFDYKLAFEL